VYHQLLATILGPLIEHENREGAVEAALAARLLAVLAIEGAVLLGEKILNLASLLRTT
jgi:hypothetical protein